MFLHFQCGVGVLTRPVSLDMTNWGNNRDLLLDLELEKKPIDNALMSLSILSILLNDNINCLYHKVQRYTDNEPKQSFCHDRYD
jgi:hypothetical protein